MRDFIASFFGPLSKQSCVYFLILSMVFFVVGPRTHEDEVILRSDLRYIFIQRYHPDQKLYRITIFIE